MQFASLKTKLVNGLYCIFMLLIALLVISAPFCAFVYPSDRKVLEYLQNITSCNKLEIVERYQFTAFSQGCKQEENIAFKVINHCTAKHLVVCGMPSPINPKLRILP